MMEGNRHQNKDKGRLKQYIHKNTDTENNWGSGNS